MDIYILIIIWVIAGVIRFKLMSPRSCQPCPLLELLYLGCLYIPSAPLVGRRWLLKHVSLSTQTRHRYSIGVRPRPGMELGAVVLVHEDFGCSHRPIKFLLMAATQAGPLRWYHHGDMDNNWEHFQSIEFGTVS